MTQSGDRHSNVASRCEDFWDALFGCRPINRLSSPAAGRNHVIIPSEFHGFWHRLLEAQGTNAADKSSDNEVGASARVVQDTGNIEEPNQLSHLS